MKQLFGIALVTLGAISQAKTADIEFGETNSGQIGESRRRQSRTCKSARKIRLDGRPQSSDRLSLGGWQRGTHASVGEGTCCAATRRDFLSEYAGDGGAPEANAYNPDCLCDGL